MLRFAASGVLLSLGLLTCTIEASAWSCVHVASYHEGYPWQDGVVAGLRKTLDGRCELTQYNLDSKRIRDDAQLRAKAAEIHAEIERRKPDILIVSDDNAAKYLVQPYYRDEKLPVVFCGINWTVAEYGFPYRNVTGMVEIAPLRPMLRWAQQISGGSRVLYVGEDTLSGRKNLERIEATASAMSLQLGSHLVDNMDDWVAALADSEAADFVILGANSGVAGWDHQRAIDAVTGVNGRLTVTNDIWMVAYADLGFVKVPEEQGEWAGQVALAIHDGMPVNMIPIIANVRWDLYQNPGIIKAHGTRLPDELYFQAKPVPGGA